MGRRYPDSSDSSSNDTPNQLTPSYIPNHIQHLPRHPAVIVTLSTVDSTFFGVLRLREGYVGGFAAAKILAGCRDLGLNLSCDLP